MNARLRKKVYNSWKQYVVTAGWPIEKRLSFYVKRRDDLRLFRRLVRSRVDEWEVEARISYLNELIAVAECKMMERVEFEGKEIGYVGQEFL